MNTFALSVAAVVLSAGMQPQVSGPDQGKKNAGDARRLGVLLIASGPTREYHFVRDSFRKQPESIDLSIVLEGAETDSDQWIDPLRMLKELPNLSDKERPRYDLVIAFDVDWLKVSKERQQALHDWVHGQGGGLVIVAGPVHSFRLARPGGHELSALLAMMPVRLVDTRLLGEAEADRANAIRLRDESSPLLRLDSAANNPRAAWDKFHGKAAAPDAPAVNPDRGFYTLRRMGAVHPHAQVAAALVDERGAEHPFLITMQHGKGRVVFLASGELWRLRTYDAAYYHRIWRNLADFATSRSEFIPRSRLIVNERVTEGDQARVEALLVDGKGRAIDADLRPMLRVTPTAGSKRQAASIPLIAHGNRLAGWYEARIDLPDAGDYALAVEIAEPRIALAAKLKVKSLNDAHFQNRLFLLRQEDLARRSILLTQNLILLETRLAASKNDALLLEARAYREAFNSIGKDAWPTRHSQVTGAIARAKKLTDFQSAHRESLDLTEKIQRVRRAFFAPNRREKAEDLSEVLRSLADAEESVVVGLENTLTHLRQASTVLDAKTIDADALDEKARGLRSAMQQLHGRNERFRQQLDELAKQDLRAETLRYLQSQVSEPIKGLAVSIDGAARALDAVREAHQKNQPTPALVADAQSSLKKLQATSASLDVPRVGAILAELANLEIEQASQTRAMAQIKSRMEADLLNQLIEGK